MKPAPGADILVDGEPATQVDARDRGLHYGDGLFETIAFVDGVFEYWAPHLTRLAQGCERLGIPMPDPDRLADDARRVCRQAGDGVVKLIVTRGQATRGYRAPEPCRPTRIVLRTPWPDMALRFAGQGVAVRTCSLRLARQPALAGIKHLNRLEQVLARREWMSDEWQEGVLCDTEGKVIEGVSSNLFLVRAGRLVTPDLSGCGVAGVIRGRLLAIAETLGMRVEIRPVPLEELRQADEIFMTNSLIGIWPVARLDRRPLAVGPVTRRLMAALRDDLRHASR